MKRRTRTDPEGQREASIQREVFRHLRERGAPGVFAFHPPNGGKRRNSTQHWLLGITAGVPDVILIRAGHVYALELKTEKGKLSTEQIAVHSQLRRAGVETYTAYGLNDALQWLERFTFLRGKSIMSTEAA